jgi:hypothetical protein
MISWFYTVNTHLKPGHGLKDQCHSVMGHILVQDAHSQLKRI